MYMVSTAWLWQGMQAGWNMLCTTDWVYETSVMENTAVVMFIAYTCKMNVFWGSSSF